MTDDDITANYHRGDLFSTAANPGRAAKARDRRRILAWLRERGDTGGTCEEAEEALGLSHQTASARFSELRRDGLIGDSGRRRRTKSGRTARVHVYNVDHVHDLYNQ